MNATFIRGLQFCPCARGQRIQPVGVSQHWACFSDLDCLRERLLQASFPGRHGDVGSVCRGQG